MKPQFFVLLVMVGLLTTCVNLFRTTSPTHSYNVYIGNGFTDEQKESIIKAFREWETKTEQTVTFQLVTWEDHSASLITFAAVTQDEMNQRYPHDIFIGMTLYHGSDNEVMIVKTLDYRDFYQTALHEFGHSLGLEHDEDMEHAWMTTMMVHTHDSTAHVTCLDLQSFCKVWHCNARDMHRCRADAELSK